MGCFMLNYLICRLYTLMINSKHRNMFYIKKRKKAKRKLKIFVLHDIANEYWSTTLLLV